MIVKKQQITNCVDCGTEVTVREYFGLEGAWYSDHSCQDLGGSIMLPSHEVATMDPNNNPVDAEPVEGAEQEAEGAEELTQIDADSPEGTEVAEPGQAEETQEL